MPIRGLVKTFFEWFGEIGFFCGRVVHAAMTPPYEFRELIRQLDEVGSKSALLVVLAGAAIGVVLSLETRDSLDAGTEISVALASFECVKRHPDRLQ